MASAYRLEVPDRNESFDAAWVEKAARAAVAVIPDRGRTPRCRRGRAEGRRGSGRTSRREAARRRWACDGMVGYAVANCGL
jgi:hypothetical protein